MPHEFHLMRLEPCSAQIRCTLVWLKPNVSAIVRTLQCVGRAKIAAATAGAATKAKTIIIGDAYLERTKSEKPNRFLCIIGAKGKVLLTFFTQK